MHQAGGLLYYDGANLNAILGRVKPGDMGFDVIHLNLHKTFSTPHGGGGPGAGPVGVSDAPAAVPADSDGRLRGRALSLADGKGSAAKHRPPVRASWAMPVSCCAPMSTRACWAREGMRRVAEFATLNANYLMAELAQAGFDIAFPQRRASHEFIVTLKGLKEQTGVSAMDVAKRLLDKGFHAPTTYFPMLVPECLLIEPTETESKQTLDAFVAAMKEILDEAYANPELVKTRPTPCRCGGSTTSRRRASWIWRGRLAFSNLYTTP